VERVRSLEAGDKVNASVLSGDVHCGTHVDAPHHFLSRGETVEKLPLDVLIGPAVVLHLPDSRVIHAADLEKSKLPAGAQRLLLRTRNSDLWQAGVSKFKEDFTGLGTDAALWIAKHGIRLVGIDYLSIQPFDGEETTHEILMRNGIVILEGLDLHQVPAGVYELICLPLTLVGAEGAPARAVLRPISKQPEAIAAKE